ncbi:hypothetical protein [Nostoc sp. ATCC 53789]|uniref:hypothetical protein n=1 Tax=Nostoc sp. ATCC 53789 TaxID=76335 RepID=UPI000DEC878F|nr:hypothetical protein [Nostoc sp. ATCC 53789]QHG21171.1 hypothetical protein GJB62_35585 [Nostoc sp. ATCC 53789]RCJ19459.1 hypothetical protein A6V25_26810 [Nostoc sp. ATCC 53789]
MARYHLLLELRDSHERLEYKINLTTAEENNPHLFFTHEAREQLRSQFQNQSQRRISDQNLNYILNSWIKDIKQGYRDTTISMTLPLLSGANIEDLSETGNHNFPPLFTPDLSGIEPQGGALPSLIFS